MDEPEVTKRPLMGGQEAQGGPRRGGGSWDGTGRTMV